MIYRKPEVGTENLYFLKLGGSLITNKMRPGNARLEVIRRLVKEVSNALHQSPDLKLVLGHGSGSFGHVPAKKFGTRDGVSTPEHWGGFLEVWRDAAALNRIVVDALREAELPAITFPPSAEIITQNREVLQWNLAPLRSALNAGMLPVIYGDVVFDREIGGTILSTEEVFDHLAVNLAPSRILIAGMEQGVWDDFPDCTKIVSNITPKNLPTIQAAISGSTATDVTGGMLSKVTQSLKMVQENPGLEVLIFSGEKGGWLEDALLGANRGTVIRME